MPWPGMRCEGRRQRATGRQGEGGRPFIAASLKEIGREEGRKEGRKDRKEGRKEGRKGG